MSDTPKPKKKKYYPYSFWNYLVFIVCIVWFFTGYPKEALILTAINFVHIDLKENSNV